MAKIITPVNVIIASFVLLIIAQFGIFAPTLSAVDLIDPDTSETFTCSTTFECYEKIQGQISGSGPALGCVGGQCIVQNCVEGDETSKLCLDGTSIVLRNCVAGEWEFTNNFCVVECTDDSTCVAAGDQNCDGNLNPIFGQCISGQCQFAGSPRCSETTIFWNQFKWQIIAGIILLLGIGGFIFKEEILKLI